MVIVEEHRSPDESLRLVVIRGDDGDVAIGFDGYTWHTHGDILAALSGLPEPQAVREFVDRIVSDNQVIVLSRRNGVVEDAWPTDDHLAETEYRAEDETLEFRMWSGRPVAIAHP